MWATKTGGYLKSRNMWLNNMNGGGRVGFSSYSITIEYLCIKVWLHNM